MSRHRRDKSEVRSQNPADVHRRKALYCLVLIFGCLLFFTGCRMDMQDQPRYKAYSKGSIRKPVEGTVPRGYLREDKQFYTGKKDQAVETTATSTVPKIRSAIQPPAGASIAAVTLYPDVVDTFPFPITEEIVNRGEERYNIFCGMCHGPTGYGDGMIVRRGYRRPPSYHTDQLRQAPVGHFFDVITNGWASMPSYAAMIPVTDRWAIVAYVRALQRSQNPQGAKATSSTSTQQKPEPSQSPVTRGRK